MQGSSLIIALTFAVLVVSACGGGFDPTLRLTLELDTASSSQSMDMSDVLDGVKDVVERRLDALGVPRKVTVEGDTRLIVEASGISADRAVVLIGSPGLLLFMEAEEDEAGDIICQAEEGERFSAEYPAQVQGGACTTAEFTGEVVWKQATGIQNGDVRALTGHQVRVGSARADIGSAGPEVRFEFTAEGGMLLWLITTRLSSPPRPLGIFLDDDLISAPRVTEPVGSSETRITVDSLDSAEVLALRLNTSALPAPVRVVAIEEIPSGETSDGATTTPSGGPTTSLSDGATPDATSSLSPP